MTLFYRYTIQIIITELKIHYWLCTRISCQIYLWIQQKIIGSCYILHSHDVIEKWQSKVVLLDTAGRVLD